MSRPLEPRTGTAPGAVDALLDDAAVFPPGLAPLDLALAAHRRYRESGLSRYVGPLLIPAARYADLCLLVAPAGPGTAGDEAMGQDERGRIDVVLIAPADGPLAALRAALHGPAAPPGLRLTGVELPLPAGCVDTDPAVRELAEFLPSRMTVAIEFDGTDPARVLHTLAGRSSARLTLGKFRTGGTTPTASPDAGTLARVIQAGAETAMPLKFTAGLHHAVTGPHGPGGSTQYGVLNVMLAVHAAVSGADSPTGPDSPAAQLLRDDGPHLAAGVIGLPGDQIAAVRSIFTSFGCCGVTEPLAELAELGVIERWEAP